MSLDYYNSQEKEWVSPRLVLYYYNLLLKKHKSKFHNRIFDKAREARVSAISLLGFHKKTGVHYFLQVPKKINESPDIVTMNRKEYSDKPVQQEIQDVEITEYGENSREDLPTFLIRKKISPKESGHAYDEKTSIICYLTKKITKVNQAHLYEKIKENNPRAHIYLLGGVPNKNNWYRLTQIWPSLGGSVEFDVLEEAIKYPKPDSLSLSIGTNKIIIDKPSGKSLPSPYNVFEINEQLISNDKILKL